VDEDYNIRLCDFGLAREMARENLTQNTTGVMRGTLQYTAPEVLEKLATNEKQDIFSFAMVAFELLTGEQLPVPGMLSVPRGDRPQLPEVTPADYRNLITDCWKPDPKDRPSAGALHNRLKGLKSKHPTDLDRRDLEGLRGRHTDLVDSDQGSSSQDGIYVYRVLYPHEIPSEGLTAKAPDSASSVYEHVHSGSAETRWISTSMNLNWSMWYVLKEYLAGMQEETITIVKIDLTKTSGSVLDLSTLEKQKAHFPEDKIGNKHVPSNNAVSAQEVCINGFVPPDAIVEIFVVDTKLCQLGACLVGKGCDKELRACLKNKASDEQLQLCKQFFQKATVTKTMKGKQEEKTKQKTFREWLDLFGRDFSPQMRRLLRDELTNQVNVTEPMNATKEKKKKSAPRWSDRIPVTNANRETRYLYIGNAASRSDEAQIREKQIAAIVQARPHSTGQNPIPPDSVELKVVALLDGEKEKGPTGPSVNVQTFFAQGSKRLKELMLFMDDALKKGNVLVHCSCGVTRSVSIVIAYLLDRLPSKYPSYDKAAARVKELNKGINRDPSKQYVEALRHFSSTRPNHEPGPSRTQQKRVRDGDTGGPSKKPRGEKKQPSCDKQGSIKAVKTQLTAVVNGREVLPGYKEEVLLLLGELQRCQMDIDTLKNTKIGIPVKPLRKCPDKEVRELADQLITCWKKLVAPSPPGLT